MSELLDRLRTALARRYVIEQELGRGGMATVYLAVDKRHDRRVAMKVFPPELAAAIGPERFKREIAITSRLTHPHILALHDSGEAAGALYYVMPLVEGESLRQRLDRDRNGLPIDEVVSIGRQIGGALAHAHRLGVVHRDVTPNNILLADGHALLADFGIARLLEGEEITETGTPLGTAMYRSPEQAAGHTEVDGRSDVYSLGCVLYEALAGAQAEPFLSNRFAKPATPLRKLNPDVPVNVEAAISRAMMADPIDRFPTAGDFERALAEPAVATRPRRRIPRSVVAASILVVAAITGFTMMRSRDHRPPVNRVLVTEFENRTGDRSLDDLGEMATDYVARGLAETRLVEVIDARAESGGPNAPAAQNAGVTTLVRGSFYKSGDSLHFESQIVDAETGKLIVSTAPSIGTVAERMQIVEKLRQRLMASFAAAFGPRFDDWTAQSIPPSYEAYKEMLAGDEANWNLDFRTSVQHYRRASQMDSSYNTARTSIVLAAGLSLDCRTADSVARTLEPVKAQLAAIDRGQLEWGVAHCHGDWSSALQAGRAVKASAPRSIGFTVLLGITAVEVFRPREALTVLESLDPSQMTFKPQQRSTQADFTILAYHMLDDPESELRVARRALQVLPDNPHMRKDELLALARLHRYKELRERREAWYRRSDLLPNPIFNPAVIDLCLGADMRAHGDPNEARMFFQAAADWYDAHRDVQEKGAPETTCSRRLLAPLYYLGRYAEAAALYRRMLNADSSSNIAHEGLGAAAARLGDRAQAGRMDQWLSTHQHHELGRSTLARARIAALLGDNTRAMELLQHAFDEGLGHRMFVHVDPDLESLHKLPAYRRLLAVTG